MLFIQSCAVYGLGAVDVALEQEFGEEGKAAEKKRKEWGQQRLDFGCGGSPMSENQCHRPDTDHGD